MVRQYAAYEIHEGYVADLLGGKMSVSSGRKWFSKGDGKTSISEGLPILWDCKSTHKPSYRLSFEVWHKVHREATMEGREPVLPVRFLGEKDAVIADYIVVPEGHYCALTAEEHLSDCLEDGMSKASKLIKRSMETPHFFSVRGTHFGLPLVLLTLEEYVELRNSYE